ncbi:ABC-type nickel/cobalt efflux system permease component RcnA [Krasilnikovia cinnamomea]|uniref:Nickel/cobalt efflux system n=1 Tax=Krasilnikovia cinnamomea TaxID=349313 RepID=A0A4Q7ZR80_9ACTN|nr:sulfite exporter TauE/SafE family protein [Krasilnikovia cinnamomea]RZU53652.1 ABC-type nickel/cobalt efflux system permease component RcnA [Krasilnikovia cinnamomea]
MKARLLAWVAAAAGAVAAVLPAAPAAAHPLGNFTVNQYAGLTVSRDAVTVDYVVDLAELPAYQTRTEQVDADRNGAVSTVEGERYAVAACAARAADARLEVAGRRAPLSVVTTRIDFPPGAAGLATLRLECVLRAAVVVEREAEIAYRNDAFADRPGWREVTAVGQGVQLLDSSVPAASRSDRLRAYPEGAAALDERTASMRARPGADPGFSTPDAGGTRAAGPDVDRLTAAFTGLIGRRHLGVGLAVLALALAAMLGAGHALAPGHGKTVMAAMLIGERGTVRQAGVVALTVTATHTTSVLVLGVVLATSLTFAPERLYGWLGVVSGLLIAAVGTGLLRRAVQRRRQSADPAHSHDDGHDHGHAHGHHPHSHHPHSHSHGPMGGGMSLRGLIAMGFAGGLVPTPSAVVVLLGAVAFGRPWYGVLLVLAYGIGMAAALVGIGLALSRWSAVLSRRLGRGARMARLGRVLPSLTSTLIVVLGCGMALRSLFAL